ncbi:hypothetical protein QTP86_017255 [Hemibagrus guttatus]|nr:hypothetical protein QTP86_017255 [Hemibagrus guttatus]
MKVWERVVEARLRKVVDICEQQYGFMPRKSTTDAIFALRILMEKYRDGQKELHCVFVDLEKAYDRVPREELWYCMRKSGVAEKYVRVVQDMYERSRTVVRCAVGQTEEFNVEVGLHQGSALSPFLFAIVMDQLSEEVRQESPWTMMFADDIVICSESREQVEENLERWRFALERRGMKVSRSKTEYMCVNEREGSGTVRLQGEEVKKVQEFKYLGSTAQSNGECGKEVKKRVQAGWNGWRKVSGVLCDQKISARIKGKVYRTVVRPAMLYGLETVSLRKRQESELEVAELKMLSSAFNPIIPDILLNKLTQLPVPTSIYQWITSFLTDRRQQLRLGKLTSNTRIISIPQGCILSPLLFSLYTNDWTSKQYSQILVDNVITSENCTHENFCKAGTVLLKYKAEELGLQDKDWLLPRALVAYTRTSKVSEQEEQTIITHENFCQAGAVLSEYKAEDLGLGEKDWRLPRKLVAYTRVNESLL